MVLRHRASRPARPEPDSGERGETLIELLLTVVLMGTAITAILSSLLVVTRVSKQNAEKTKAAAAIQTFAEQVVVSVVDPNLEATGDAAVRYTDCAVPDGPLTGPSTWSDGSYSDLTRLPVDPTGANDARSAYNGFRARISSIEFLQLSNPALVRGFDSFGAPKWQNSCANVPDGGLQRLTIEIRRNGEVVDILTVVKRNATCPSTFDNADLGPC